MTFARNHLAYSVAITRNTLQSEAVRQLLDPHQRRRRFDLIVHEVFLNEALLGFGAHFNAPTVAFSPLGTYKLSNDMVAGMVSPTGYVPHITLPLTDRMTFAQRTWNAVVTLGEQLYVDLFYMPAHAQLYAEHFPAAVAAGLTLSQLRANVSLVLLNTHASAFGWPRPYMPAMIDVGGMHLDPDARRLLLPPRVARFLDAADANGAILFPMGSVQRDTEMAIDRVLAIRSAFERLVRERGLSVLWKWDDATPTADDANVANALIMRSAWLPQQAVLAHRNVRAFITHGGLLSCMEAVWHAVPLVGVPMRADQPQNVARAVFDGYAVQLDYANVTEQSLVWAVGEVLDNAQYGRRAAVVASRFRDQPPDGGALRRAVYWIEYVGRHGGATHLRSASGELNVLAFYGLDVWLGLLVAIAVVGCSMCRCVRMY